MALGLPCSCGNVLVASPSMAGQTIPCSACGKGIIVPAMGQSARPRSAIRHAQPAPVEPENTGSSLPIWLGAGGGGVVVVGLLVALVAWCYSGNATKEQTPPLVTQLVQAAENKVDSKDQNPNPPPKKEDADPNLTPLPKKDPSTPTPIYVEPPPKKDVIQPVDPPSDPPIEKKDPPKEVIRPIDPPNKVKPVLPPIKTKEAPAFIVPIFVTEDFKEAKLPYKVRYLKLPENFKPKTLRLGVTPPVYDDMGKLLDDLGEGFRHTNISANDLANLDRLRDYDVIFLTCGDGAANGAVDALRKFVDEGGTLYASDLRYELILQVFPEMRPSYQVLGGNGNQTLKATIVDPGLRQYLGRNSIPLHFNLDGWKPAIFDKKKTKSVMEGNYYAQDGGKPILARLLVKFRSGEGNVVFTSFHNAAQNNELERKLLKYLVFTAITAKQESKVNDLLLKEGFALLDLKNHQVSVGKSTAKQTISHGKGGLQFAVGYDTLGAKLRLTLTGPDGQKIEHEDNAMFLLDIPNAPAGQWTYSVTATSVPFANFPFVLAVGKKN